jgi:hypothetical protein
MGDDRDFDYKERLRLLKSNSQEIPSDGLSQIADDKSKKWKKGCKSNSEKKKNSERESDEEAELMDFQLSIEFNQEVCWGMFELLIIG